MAIYIICIGHTKTDSYFYNVGFHVSGLSGSMTNLCIQTGFFLDM